MKNNFMHFIQANTRFFYVDCYDILFQNSTKICQRKILVPFFKKKSCLINYYFIPSKQLVLSCKSPILHTLAQSQKKGANMKHNFSRNIQFHFNPFSSTFCCLKELGHRKKIQRIVYLWRNHQKWNHQMWNHQFQYLLHIPLRRVINVFHHINDNGGDQKKNESNSDIEYLWSMIINELHIPQWNSNDTDCIINSMNGLLLLLDGFDEIANEIQTNTNLQSWLQHCTSNQKYSIIITSRANAMCPYLNNPRVLNVIGFQSQDIQNYVNAYFKNNNESNVLMEKLNNSRSLKLLSDTSLYLRLCCYLSKQDKLNNDK
ncbi:NACHT domain-containing protein [Reticulomyxa filosa]|uniref:NACHT domain-containing protein n=1 Tax=Reticulomyxa filosa TaxID=46433 RepID=X6M1C0_RETFI|nr:NACHT domain-containing protein [Reticulomyxa filosa]|eukprot:ETO07933.1 NACHT domain-containing protein [Reticulomyxa filosa]